MTSGGDDDGDENCTILSYRTQIELPRTVLQWRLETNYFPQSAEPIVKSMPMMMCLWLFSAFFQLKNLSNRVNYWIEYVGGILMVCGCVLEHLRSAMAIIWFDAIFTHNLNNKNFFLNFHGNHSYKLHCKLALIPINFYKSRIGIPFTNILYRVSTSFIPCINIRIGVAGSSRSDWLFVSEYGEWT